MKKRVINNAIEEIKKLSLEDMKQETNITLLYKLKDIMNDLFNMYRIPHGLKNKVDRRS